VRSPGDVKMNVFNENLINPTQQILNNRTKWKEIRQIIWYFQKSVVSVSSGHFDSSLLALIKAPCTPLALASHLSHAMHEPCRAKHAN
jgi:uncharacterized protein (UPF0218 family)